MSEAQRRILSTLVKAVLTVGAFYLLLTHGIDDGAGGKVSIAAAIKERLRDIDWLTFLPFVVGATAIKLVGIFCSMARWHLLLIGQGIRFDFRHIAGAFLTGRFLGTFLPSTIGLDGYKLYDAARHSGRVVEPAAATAVEKAMGLMGLLLSFLVTLPFGWHVLHDSLGDLAVPTIIVAIALSVGGLGGFFLLLFRPGAVEALLRLVPAFGRKKVEGFVGKVSRASTAYRGKGGLLASVIGLSFVVHFATAVMYWFTARAVGVMDAEFWKVAFASSIQIFATVLSPFTIAGEGIREIAQALLLSKHLGATEAVLSAALGFWAAEAPTMFGAIFLWTRRADYKPRRVEVVEVTTSAAAISA
jgi:glycosyltransferase 2 family protein